MNHSLVGLFVCWALSAPGNPAFADASRLPITTTTPAVKILLAAARNANWPGGLPLHELLDIPMRDPNVTLGPDGYYYLVGTTDPPSTYTKIDANDLSGQMWTINDGIRMWKSPDLIHWTSLRVWI